MKVSHVRRTAGTCPRHCLSSPAGPRREPDLADLCATRRQSRIAASRKYSAGRLTLWNASRAALRSLVATGARDPPIFARRTVRHATPLPGRAELVVLAPGGGLPGRRPEAAGHGVCWRRRRVPAPFGRLPGVDVRDSANRVLASARRWLDRVNVRHPWNHNEHFHGWILRNLPARRRRRRRRLRDGRARREAGSALRARHRDRRRCGHGRRRERAPGP